MKNVHIVSPVDYDHVELFKWMGYNPVKTIGNADLICFTGGSDVSPFLYAHKAHPSSYCNPDRDYREQDVYESAKGRVPFCGICRGGQMLNILNGGTMYQDVTRHGTWMGHIMKDEDTGEELLVSSTHHQMMKMGEGGVLIASATEGGKRVWWDRETEGFKEERSDKDIEVVLYPKTKSLCFQPHPEYSSTRFMPMREYFKKQVAKLFE